MLKLFSLEGETALITGGGSGLGLGMARCFVGAGARVVLAGRRVEVLAEAAKDLGPQASFVAHDVTALDQASALIVQAEKAAGSSISILVNNAGIHLKKWAVDTSPAEFDGVMRTHVAAAHALTQAALPGMLERKHGNILFTASMVSFMGIPQVIAYTAAKSALAGMARALTAEVAAQGIRVNAIAPGWIQSPMLDKALKADAQRKAKILGRTPMGHFGEPSDIGMAAVYLCSPAAKFVSGVVLPVDGGAVIGF